MHYSISLNRNPPPAPVAAPEYGPVEAVASAAGAEEDEGGSPSPAVVKEGEEEGRE